MLTEAVFGAYSNGENLRADEVPQGERKAHARDMGCATIRIAERH
jgi:hypothetical protein